MRRYAAAFARGYEVHLLGDRTFVKQLLVTLAKPKETLLIVHVGCNWNVINRFLQFALFFGRLTVSGASGIGIGQVVNVFLSLRERDEKTLDNATTK